jgi:hypothetical protein
MFLEKLTVAQPLEKFPGFYEIGGSTTAFPGARHFSIS